MSASQFEGRALAELSSGGQFALWCLRTRLLCAQREEDPAPRLGHGFELAQIPEAHGDFEALYGWLAGCATRTLHLGCLKCRRVTEAEGLLLAALASFQWNNPRAGEILLASLLPPVAASNAAVRARRLAAAMRAADLPIGVAKRAGPRARSPASTAGAAAGAAPGTAIDRIPTPTSKLVH